MVNFSRVLAYNADVRPLKGAVHFLNDSLRYSELWQRVTTASAALAQRGVQAGDRVAYLGYNHYQFLVLFFALARLGAMLVPLNFRLAAAEHRAILADSEPRSGSPEASG